MILITGTTGLLGSHLLKQLAKNNNSIVALYNKNKPSGELEKLATWKQVDILDIVALEEVMQNVQQVYHCAAIVSFNPKEKSNKSLKFQNPFSRLLQLNSAFQTIFS